MTFKGRLRTSEEVEDETMVTVFPLD